MNHLKRDRIIVFALYFLGAFAIVLSMRPLWIFLGIVIIIAGLAYQRKNCSCPACGKGLELRGALPQFCPKCGCDLRHK